jgi:hypothetical protein
MSVMLEVYYGKPRNATLEVRPAEQVAALDGCFALVTRRNPDRISVGTLLSGQWGRRRRIMDGSDGLDGLDGIGHEG